MPYITQKRRAALLAGEPVADVGELNFILTKLCLDALATRPNAYGQFNAVIGALECAKLELYRRKLAPYEDFKMGENGDVY